MSSTEAKAPKINPFSIAAVSRYSIVLWMIVALVGSAVLFRDGLAAMIEAWARPEYSYGPLVPFITGYLALREYRTTPPSVSKITLTPGILLTFLSICLGLLGNLAKIPDLSGYGFIFFCGGMILTLAGWPNGIRFWPAWLHLFFMLPLPQFLYLHVSTYLQHISSELGVFFIRLVSIPVFLEGNIIDLGVYQLQVAEACSGLRYLFPLFSFGWIISVLYNGPNWHRVILFFSVIPITIFMNSLRIGVVGILVNKFGIEQAEGFLHFFEGWIIFLSCTLLIYSEAWLLSFTRREKYGHVLDLDIHSIFDPLSRLKHLPANSTFAILSLATLAVGIGWEIYPKTVPQNIERQSFTRFPLSIGEWIGKTQSIDANTAKVLRADDYLAASYSAAGKEITLLLTYYKSQTEGSGIHSPEVCLPSGGWEVSDWQQKNVSIQGPMASTLTVNRAVIRKGISRQLVYYWFEARGRRTQSDYEAKFLSMWDTVTIGRSDGGLVRIVTPLGPTELEQSGDERLQTFATRLIPSLRAYFPATI